jgi:glycosyltransferase involved in cell wall biosynthesis
VESRPRVSVIISTFNYARYVGAAIDSVLAQTFEDFEIIVVDDGSTDNTAEVLSRYGTKIVTIRQANAGQGASFNAAFLRSTGEIIAFLDADDSWAPEKLERVVRAADAMPGAVLIYHQVAPTDASGKPVGPVWPRTILTGSISEILERTGGYWPCPPSSALAYPRTLLAKLLPLDEAMWRIAADAYLADLAPFFGPISGIEAPLTHYRVHGDNYGRATGPNAARLQFLSDRFERLQAALTRFGIASPISLRHHHPYQYLAARLGDLRALVRLLSVAVTGTAFIRRRDAIRAPASAVYRFLVDRAAARRPAKVLR